MKSFTTLRNLYGSLSNNTESANLTLGDQLINDGHRKALRKVPRLREKTASLSTSTQTQFISLPYDCEQVMDGVKVTISNTVYTPKEAPSRDFWNRLNQSVVYSNIPEWYFVDEQKRIGFYPIPASTTSNAVTLPYKRRVKDLSIADYTTGGILTTTNGGTTVTGTGTTWTVAMAGRYLRITDSDTANKGDGEWYEIASVASTTSLTLVKGYNGTAITAGNAAYTMGQMSLLPEDYHDAPVNYALAQYWDSRDQNRATTYRSAWNQQLVEMKTDYGNSTDNVVIDNGMDTSMINPNLTISL